MFCLVRAAGRIGADRSRTCGPIPRRGCSNPYHNTSSHPRKHAHHRTIQMTPGMASTGRTRQEHSTTQNWQAWTAALWPGHARTNKEPRSCHRPRATPRTELHKPQSPATTERLGEGQGGTSCGMLQGGARDKMATSNNNCNACTTVHTCLS